MSPDHQAGATFRPAQLADGRPARDDERRRAAGYAAGWAAGSRAAAEIAVEQERLRAEANARAEAGRDAAVAEALAALEHVTAAVAARLAPARAEVAVAVHRGAVELAEAVLARELRPGPESARDLLGRALALPADAGLHTIRVSPADLEHVTAVLDAREASLPPGVEVVADPALMPGDVVGEHALLTLDGQIRGAVQRARHVLEEDA